MSFNRIIMTSLLGLLGWALCGAIMFIGMSVMSLETTLIVHAIGAPVIFFIISLVDFFLVALVINKSLEMFQGLLGTWIPFTLIFSSTYITGSIVGSRGNSRQR